MKNQEKKRRNLQWFSNLELEEQLDIFQDYTEMLRIVANNLMLEEINSRSLRNRI